MTEGTVLVRGKRVPAWCNENGKVWRDVRCPNRGKMKLAACGPKITDTFQS